MDISLETEIKEVRKFLTRLEKKQLPFATSRAINDVAFDVRKMEMRSINRHIDNPTPFTKRGFQVKKSHKRQENINADVFIKPDQWDYLKYQVVGGVRSEDNITTPVNVRVNKYGNIPALRRKKPLWIRGQQITRGTFVKNINGTYGVWGRSRNAIRLLVAFIKKAKYKRIFPFKKIAETEVRKTFAQTIRKHLNNAIATAKR